MADITLYFLILLAVLSISGLFTLAIAYGIGRFRTRGELDETEHFIKTHKWDRKDKKP